MYKESIQIRFIVFPFNPKFAICNYLITLSVRASTFGKIIKSTRFAVLSSPKNKGPTGEKPVGPRKIRARFAARAESAGRDLNVF